MTDEPATRPFPGKERINTRAAGVIGIAVMCSRVLGLIRETVFAALFGGGREMDVFIAAFRIPNLLRDLFAEGALSTAFVTVFSRTIVTDGEQAAWRLANKVMTLATVFMSAITLLGILIAPWIVGFIAPGFDADKAAMTTTLVRVMYPFILLVSLAALVMGMLNARNVFGMPAMASSFFNLGSIIGGVAVGWWLDPSFGSRALLGLAIGTLIGGALQLGVQLPSLRRAGFRFRPDWHWRSEGVRNMLTLMGPAIIAASSVQVNVLVNSMFASQLGDGPIAWLNNAFRLMQLPLGLFGVALGTVALPVLARLAAGQQMTQFRTELARAMRLSFVLTIPATVGLMVLAEPIMSVVYQHGKFTAEQTAQAAGALQLYATGLCAYATMKVLVNAFYAVDKRRTPMLVSLVAIGLNALLCWLFVTRFGWGHRGLAASTACIATFNFAVLYVLMHRHLRSLDTAPLLRTLAKVLLSGAVLALAAWAGRHYWLSDWATQAFFPKAARLLAVITLSGAAFVLAALALRVEELSVLAATVRRRLARRRAG
ncbi:MAG TPA: murein biosynthesis integral membrane protein MurJ [Steroidobacteraceae bacterium]|nr:murein biosynthesis integral membrane protein MurJ [Steroidobacteraceae bacterium]